MLRTIFIGIRSRTKGWHLGSNQITMWYCICILNREIMWKEYICASLFS